MATVDASETGVESWFALSDGLKVLERTWMPATPPKAHLLVMHGFDDHSARYGKFAYLLSSKYPIKVTAWDRRGWGRTVREDSDKGLSGDGKLMLADLHEYLKHAVATTPDLPLYIKGHSMGGQESLWYLLSPESPFNTAADAPKVAGLILSAPYITLVVPPPSLAIKIGRKAAWVTPNRQIKNEPKTDGLSSDAEGVQDWLKDPLCHHTGTLIAVVATFDREAELTTLAKSKRDAKKPDQAPKGVSIRTRLPCPVLWSHGTKDGASRYDMSQKLFERLDGYSRQGDGVVVEQDKVFTTYDGWMHALCAEAGDRKETYARDVGDWIVACVARS